jgi:hypothetical protein
VSTECITRVVIACDGKGCQHLRHDDFVPRLQDALAQLGVSVSNVQLAQGLALAFDWVMVTFNGERVHQMICPSCDLPPEGRRIGCERKK